MKFKYLLLCILVLIIGGGIFLFKAHVATLTPKVPVAPATTAMPIAPVPAPAPVTTVTPAATVLPAVTRTATVAADKNSQWINKEMHAIEPQATNLNKNVLKIGLIAYQHAQKKGVTNNPLLTLVDYSKPSARRRLWVIDLNREKVLFNTWVAHGKNSGNVNSASFSNKPESLKSSIGVFVTGDIYSGKHGNSLRVQGLESGFNDNAYSRAIVFHGANYVSASIAKTGRIGRSWGCWAVSQNIIPSLIKAIKNNALVVAYYPDKKWLSHSRFLNN